MLRVRKVAWIIIVLILWTSACKNHDDVKPVAPALVSFQILATHTVAELQLYLSVVNLASYVVNDVDLYTITYNTKYKDRDIVASGLVALPKTTAAVPMISFQHGTIVAHAEAPSLLPGSSTDLILYAGLASPGFIAVIPDYIGFGSSASIRHPYFVEEPTATAIADMLKAAKELAVRKNTTYNGKLFLAGYSQGGYATMAAHKSIEQNGLAGFQLIASFPAAGGYDVKNLQEYFFGLTTYPDPVYLAYMAVSYQANENWTKPLSDFFNEPYADRIPDLFDGTKTGGQINAQLTTTLADYIQPHLLAAINTDPQYQYIVDAFNKNSLTDWKPSIRMVMYHGDADTTVPYSNSMATYQKLLANGASASVVSLITLSGKDHSTGVIPYFQDFVPKMISLK
jgi:pimeloyl-ACP methyl ester carboxylesterase